MKRLFAILLTVVLVVLSCVTAAAEVTADNHKDSFQSYAGKGNLKYTSQSVYGFDSTSGVFSSDGHVFTDYNNYKEGEGSLACNMNGNGTAFELKTGTINTGISNPLKETLKFWVYVNNIDLLECDHDDVYETAQKGSGTLVIQFAESDMTKHKYSIQHTLEGSGWHLVEISFNTHNVVYETFKNLDLTKIGWMKVIVEASKGLELRFDDLKKYTYTNNGYEEPECPNNGRWISTCDYEALDGSILTEWYASSFDLNEKVQGSSSLSLTAHKEHVDFRAVWGGVNVAVNRQNDYFHMDVYISDIDAIGKNFQARLSQCESGSTGNAVISFGYGLANSFANSATGFKQGWNSVDIPLFMMEYTYDTSYFPNGISNYVIDHVVMFWEGASADKEYTVKYDNMYIYERTEDGSSTSTGSTLSMSDEKVAEIAAGIVDKTVTSVSAYSDSDIQKIKEKIAASYPDVEVVFNEDGTVTVTENKNDDMMLYIIIAAAAAVAVIVIIIIVIVIVKRKKKAPAVKPVEPAKKD